jgi:hypothetical protein
MRKRLGGYRPSLQQPLAVSLMLMLVVFNSAGNDWASPLQDPFRIIVLQGDRGINNTQTRAESSLVVQVQDANGPVAGARVTFTAPSDGASGIFSNGRPVITVTADPSGIAEARGFRPNGIAGSFEIVATIEDSRAKATIAQTNVSPKGGFNKKWIAVIVGAAGAGAALSLAGGQKSPASTPSSPSSPPASTPPPAATIQAGAPTVGPPG